MPVLLISTLATPRFCRRRVRTLCLPWDVLDWYSRNAAFTARRTVRADSFVVEISKTGIRGLERYAKKYGIDYAIRKDTSEVPPRYLVFFKAPDAEAFHSAFKEYSASLLNKDKRPSVLARLQELVQAAAELPGKVRHKEQERGL